ncbi:hypothetical protein H6S61_02290 [Vibrio vulnificus]|uniref:hypothetical protein n=1 Tax=Vibrio vulnificus TaxID=672 RepID=UPI00163BBCA7|nr:hypothetical protein [Vibrio vulnificus]QNE01255.1 hypothetical protein H6S61_02290 [Vibrio vulnificus]
MADRSIEVFKEMSVSMQKFDYFVLGISIALFAYLGKDYSPVGLGINVGTVELIALTALFISIVFGYFRLKCDLTIKSLNFSVLSLGEKRGALTEALQTSTQKYNAETGDVINPHKARLEIDVIKKITDENLVLMKSKQDNSVWLLRFRDLFLAVGFLCLLITKYLDLILSWTSA